MSKISYEIQEFLGAASLMVHDRGRKLYKFGKIEQLEKFGQIYTAKMRDRGGKFYTVTMEMTEDNRVQGWECNCGHQYSGICKHMIAAVLAIRDGAYTETVSVQRIEAHLDLPALLAQASKEELMMILETQCKTNKQLCVDVVSVLDSDGAQEFLAIQEMVRSIVMENMSEGVIDAQGCKNICKGMLHILKKATRRMEQENYEKAFAIVRYVLVTTMALRGKLDNDGLSHVNKFYEVMYTALQFTEDCVDAVIQITAAQEWQRYLMPWLDTLENDAFAQEEETRYQYLREIIPLVHQTTKQQVFAALDRIQAKHWEEFEDKAEYAELDKDIRYKIILQVDGHAAAREFINQNLETKNFRMLAIEDDIENGNYAGAERLCLQGEQDKGNISRRGMEILCRIYDAWGQQDKLLEILWRLVSEGDLWYYEQLKQLLMKIGQWQQKYPELLAKLKTVCSAERYMDKLLEEGETEELMEEVRSHPETVFQYGDWLTEDYMEDVCSLAVEIIYKEAETADKRRDYQQVCRHLDLLIDFGGMDLANDLLEEFRDTYKRKPAFMNELDRFEQDG